MFLVSTPQPVAEVAADTAKDALKSVSFDSVTDFLLELDATDAVSIWDGSSSTAPVYSSSDGAYIIDSAAKLRGFANAVSNGTTYSGYTVKLTVNIDWNGKEWVKIGTGSDKAFKGTFDGNGCYVSNYTHTSPGDVSGFFGYLYDATVKNLTLKNIRANNGNRYIGLFCGPSNGTTTVDNVDIIDSTFTATYRSTKSGRYGQSGVLFGVVDGGTLNIKNCDFTNVSGSINDSRGGIIVGNAYGGTTVNITNCKFNNVQYISNDSDAGLAVGMAEGAVNIDGIDISNGCKVAGWENTGLIGQVTGAASVRNVTIDGFTVNKLGNNNGGGLIGQVGGTCTISNITSVGLSVVSNKGSHTGGLVGLANNNLTVSNANLTNTVMTGTGTDNGGIAGYLKGYNSITDVTINGAQIAGNGTCLGGILGYINAGTGSTLKRITLKGNISLTNTGGDTTSAIVAYNDSGNDIYFYDINTKDAVITRNISNKSNQAHIIGYSDGNVYISTENMAYNEICAINIENGGNRDGGLVGYVSGKAVSLKNTRVNGDIYVRTGSGTDNYDHCGGLVAVSDNVLTVDNVIVTGSIGVRGDQNVGGVVGWAGNNVTVKNFTVGSGNINIVCSYECAGGIVGREDSSGYTIDISGVNLTSVTVDAESIGSTGRYVGGFVGYSASNVKLTDCSIDTVSIKADTDCLGGVAGYMNGGGVIAQNVNLGTVTITTPSFQVGGFAGFIRGASSFTDCTVSNVALTAGDVKVGGVIGAIENNVTVKNCVVTDGYIKGKQYVGGIIGYIAGNQPMTVDNCSNGADVTITNTSTSDADGAAGGIIGVVYDTNSAAVTGCSNTGKVSCTSVSSKIKHFGGIIGWVRDVTTVQNSYNAGEVCGNTFNGGIVAHASAQVTIQYCYNKGYVHAFGTSVISNSYYSAGGIACYVTGANSLIEYCFNRGNVEAYSTSAYYNGGIIAGLNATGAVVQYCYTTGAITGYSASYYRAAIVGNNAAGTVQYCYSNALTSDSYMYGSNAGTVNELKYVATANLQGTKYASNTKLGTVYFTSDDSNKNDLYPILFWMGDPFQKNETDGCWDIWNVGHYSQFLNKVNSGITFEGETVRLMDDVDLGSLESTTTIGGNGSTTNGFKGTFEGNNHAFLNFTLDNGSTQYTGFFGYVNSATIKNLIIDSFVIKGGRYTGGLVGYANGSCTFTNITVRNGITVTGGQNTGGLVGYSANAFTLSNFTSTGTIDVNCAQDSGGLLGATPQNVVFTNISLGAVDVDSTSQYVGGLAGLVDGTGASKVENITASGEINVYTTSGSYIAGLIGRVDGNFTLQSTSGKVNKLSDIVVKSGNGGFVGGLTGNHTDSSATHTIKNLTTGNITITATGEKNAALVAYSTNAVNMSNINLGNVVMNVSASISDGAFVGWTKSTVTVTGTNTVGTITITGTGKYLAGIVGEADSNVSLSGITTGAIVINGGSGTDIGGYTGNVTGTTTVSSCSSPSVKLYGTGNTRGGVIAYSQGNATVTSTKISTVIIGTSSAKASNYAAGYIAYTEGSASVTGAEITLAEINASGQYVGTIIGRANSTATLNSIRIGTSTLLGSTNVGGFVGYTDGVFNLYGTNSADRLSVTSSGANCGGAVGYCVGANINNTTLSIVYITASGNNKSGFVANSGGSANVTFTGSNSIGSISINQTSHNYIGMFAGSVGGKLTVSGANASMPDNFTYVGDGDNNYSRIGAIAGYVASAEISGYSFGNITIGSSNKRGSFYIGGFIGECGGALTVKDCSAQNITLYTASEYTKSGTFSHSSSKSWTGGIAGKAGGAAEFENIEIGAVNITSEGYDVAGILGSCGGDAKITNVKILGETSSISVQMWDCGGLLGYVAGKVTAVNCENHAAVSFMSCRAYNGDSFAIIGGIAGRAVSGGSFTNCVNYGKITYGNGGEFKYTGGILGYAGNTTTFNNCRNEGDVSSNGVYVGGIFGGYDNNPTVTITNCTNTADINGTQWVGGISGRHFSSISTNQYLVNTGNVSGTTGIGGIFGVADGSAPLRYCYNWGDVSGSDCVGGVLGSQRNSGATITSCYSKGKVTGTNSVGGVVGEQKTAADLSKNYYLDSSCSYGAASGTNANAIASTAAQFASGEIGWKMNTSNAPYKQDIGTDAYPTFDGAQINRVVFSGEYSATVYCNDTVELPMYRQNSNNYNCYHFVDSDGVEFTGQNLTKDYNVTVTFKHSYANPVIVAATCTEDGYTESYCIGCGDKHTGDVVTALGHQIRDTVVAPTCTSEGYTEHRCLRSGCDYLVKDSIVPATSHSYSVVQVVPPTHDDRGYSVYECSGCGDRYVSDYVDAKGHSYEKSEVAATCTTGGYTLWKCSDCGESYKENIIGPLGHKYTDVTVDPTCTDEGYTLHTCSRCSNSYKDAFVPVDPNAHHWVVTQFDGTSHTYECEYCHKTKAEEHVKDMDGKCLCDDEFKDGAYEVDIMFNNNVICFKYMPVGEYFDFTSFSVPVKYRSSEYRVGHKTVLVPRGEHQGLQNGEVAVYDARFDYTDYAGGTFDVTVVDKGVTSVTSYSWEQKATVKAGGSNFLYWTDEYGNIVSTYKTYYFLTVKDTTLTAVYSGDVSDPSTEKAFIKTNFAEYGDDGSLTFYSERCVNYKSYKLLSHGIILAPSSKVGNDYNMLYNSLVCGSGNSNTLVYDKAVPEGQSTAKCYGLFTVAVPQKYLQSHSLDNELWYARSYVLVQNLSTGEVEYHYGDIAELDLSDANATFTRRTDVKNDNLLIAAV